MFKPTQAPLFANFGFTAWKVQVYLLKRVRLNLQDLINIGVVTIMSFFKSALWDTYCIVTSDTFGWIIYVFRVALPHFYPKHIQNFAFQNDFIKKKAFVILSIRQPYCIINMTKMSICDNLCWHITSVYINLETACFTLITVKFARGLINEINGIHAGLEWL